MRRYLEGEKKHSEKPMMFLYCTLLVHPLLKKILLLDLLTFKPVLRRRGIQQRVQLNQRRFC